MNHEEVIAATREWIEKAVIGLNLCPFAKSVYVKNQVRIVVSSARHIDGFLEDLDRELDHLAEVDPEVTDTTLLIHPTLFPDFLDFNDVHQIADEAVADLYDPLVTPPALLKAHQKLDAAVDAAYGRKAHSFANEAERVAFLFECYQHLATPLAPATPAAKTKGRRKAHPA